MTDADGIDDVIGGQLEDIGSRRAYSAFATQAAEGGYAMRLSWAEIHQVRLIQFRESEERGFRAVFFDQVGNQVSAELRLALHCEGEGGCDGVCTPLDQDEHCGECCQTCQPGSLCDGTSRTCACEVGYHACADNCLLDTSSASCGLRCQPCPGDANGITTCEAGQCGVECNAGFRYCQDLCRPCPTTGVAVVRCRGDAVTLGSRWTASRATWPVRAPVRDVPTILGRCRSSAMRMLAKYRPVVMGIIYVTASA